MSFFTFTKLGRAVVLAAVLAVGAASAEETLFYSSGGTGGIDLARLRYEGNVFKQRNDVASDGGSEYGALPNFYFALKYYTVANYGNWGLGGDFVFIMPDGRFHGVDMGVSFSAPGLEGDTMRVMYDFGVGYSYGGTLYLPGGLEILLGGSAGLWMGVYHNVDGIKDETELYFNFIGPSARVHWNSIELMYRVMLGFFVGDESGFKATHRFSIGYCFGKDSK